jgi:thiamine phosphate synthase YjbQ (UPF0047 family)
MDGFTPTFFLNLVVALLSGGVAYGVLKTDLANTIERVSEETRLREKHEKDDDATHHDIRGELQTVSSRIATMEGQMMRGSDR